MMILVHTTQHASYVVNITFHEPWKANEYCFRKRTDVIECMKTFLASMILYS